MNKPIFLMMSLFTTTAIAAAPIQGTISQNQSDVCLMNNWGYFCGKTYDSVGTVTCNGNGTCSGSNHFSAQQPGYHTDRNSILVFYASLTNSALTNTTNRWLRVPPGSTVDVGTCDVPGGSASGDTYVRLFDSNGVQVAANDDASGCGYRSKLSYVVPDYSNGIYQIRAGCYGSSSCSGIVASEIESPWTEWFDRDNPSGSGDYELIDDLVSSGSLDESCDHPVAIECQMTNGQGWQYSPDLYHCSTESGGYCTNDEQGGGYCEDYRVRFICP